jgi:hypothetical protein
MTYFSMDSNSKPCHLWQGGRRKQVRRTLYVQDSLQEVVVVMYTNRLAFCVAFLQVLAILKMKADPEEVWRCC